jgi:hypothetical protein
VLYKCALSVLIVARVFFWGGGVEMGGSEFLNLWYKCSCYVSICCWCCWPCAFLFLVVCVF